MTVKGGTDYEINLSGNFEEKFNAITKRMEAFTSSVKKLDGLTASASKNIDKLAQSLDKADKQSKNQSDEVVKGLNAQAVIRKKILGLEKQIIAAGDSQVTELKAELQVLKAIEKAEIEKTIASQKSAAAAETTAKAETRILTTEKKIVESRKAIEISLANGANTLTQIAERTGITSSKAEKYTRELAAQGNQLAKQVVAPKDSAAEAVRASKAQDRLTRESEKAAKAQERATKARVQALTPLQAEQIAKQRIQETSNKTLIAERQIALARQKGASTAAEIAKYTGLSENRVRALTGETKKATSSANKLLLGFRQVLFTVARFQIARRIFSFIQESVSDMIDFNAKIESAQIGIASLVASVAEVRDVSGGLVGGIEAFNAALRVSDDIVEQLRVKAATTEATFEGLVQAFQTAVGPGLSAGLELDEILETTTDITRAATQLGVPVNQLSEEIRSVLNGTIKLSQTRLAPLITNEEIRNAREAGNLYDVLSERLSVFRESSAQVAETFAVLKSNVEDSTKAVLASGADSYFNSVKGLLKTVSSLLIKTGKDGIRVVNPQARKVVESVGNALGFVIDKITEFLEDEDTLESLTEVFQSLGTAIKVLGSVGDIALRGILDAARAITVPLNLIADFFSAITGDSQLLGSALAPVLSSTVAIVALMKTYAFLTASVKNLTLVTGRVVDFILGKKRQEVALEGQKAAAVATTNTALTVQNGILTIGATKVALMTAGLSILAGLLASFIAEWVTGQKAVNDELDELLEKSDGLADSFSEAKKRLLEVPVVVAGARVEADKLAEALDKAAQRATKIKTEIAINRRLQGLTDTARDYQEVLAKVEQQNKVAVKLGQDIVNQKRKQVAEAEKELDVNVEAINTRIVELRKVEKALRDGESEGVLDAKEKRDLLIQQRAINRDINQLLFEGNRAASKGIKEQIDATTDALLEERKVRRDLERDTTPVAQTGPASFGADLNAIQNRAKAIEDSARRERALQATQRINIELLADAREEDLKRLGEINVAKAKLQEAEKTQAELEKTTAAEARLRTTQFLQEQEQKGKATSAETRRLQEAVKISEAALKIAEIQGKVGDEEVIVVTNRLALIEEENRILTAQEKKNIDSLKTDKERLRGSTAYLQVSRIVASEEENINAKQRERKSAIDILTATQNALLQTSSAEADVVLASLRAELSRLSIAKEIAGLKSDNARTEVEASSDALTDDEKRLKLLEIDIAEKRKSRDIAAEERATQLDVLKIRESQAATDKERAEIQQDISFIQETEQARLRATQAQIDSLVQEQTELNRVIRETGDERERIADEKKAIKTAETKAKLESDLAKAKLENGRLIVTNAARQAALDQQALEDQRVNLNLTEDRLQLQIDEARLAVTTESNGKKRAILEQKLNDLVSSRGKKLDLENQKLKNAEDTVKRSSALASNSLAAGVEDGFRKFNAEAKTSAQIFSEFIVEGIQGVSDVLSDQFTAIFDPRKSAENTEDAFADMFYSIAGDAAAAFTEQIIAQGLESVFLQTGFFEGILSPGDGDEGIAGLFTSAFSGIFGEDGVFGDLFGGGDEGGGLFGGIGDLFGGGGEAEEVAQPSAGEGLIVESLGFMQDILTQGFAKSVQVFGQISSFFGTLLGFIPTIISALFSILVPLLSIALTATLMLGQLIIQTVWAIVTAIATSFQAAKFYKGGGMVQAFASGGRVRHAPMGSGLRQFQKQHGIPSSDTVPAMLTPEEFVMKKAAVKKYGAGFMNAVNSLSLNPASFAGVAPTTVVAAPATGEVQAFAEGGLVGSSMFQGDPNARNQSPLTVLPILTANNATTEKLLSEGNDSLDNNLRDSNVIDADPNKTEEWK